MVVCKLFQFGREGKEEYAVYDQYHIFQSVFKNTINLLLKGSKTILDLLKFKQGPHTGACNHQSILTQLGPFFTKISFCRGLAQCVMFLLAWLFSKKIWRYWHGPCIIACIVIAYVLKSLGCFIISLSLF